MQSYAFTLIKCFLRSFYSHCFFLEESDLKITPKSVSSLLPKTKAGHFLNLWSPFRKIWSWSMFVLRHVPKQLFIKMPTAMINFRCCVAHLFGDITLGQNGTYGGGSPWTPSPLHVFCKTHLLLLNITCAEAQYPNNHTS